MGRKVSCAKLLPTVKSLKRRPGFAVQNGFSAIGLDFSPIKGPEGNIEFLMHVRKCVQPEGLPQRTIEAVVSKAHESL